MRRLWIGLTVVGGAGLLMTIVLTVIEGVNYRLREEQGLEPVPASELVANLSYAGLALFVLAAVALAVVGIVRLIRARR